MSELNPLNDLSRVYLDEVALMNRQEEQNDVERWQGVLDDQMEKSSKKLATLGAPMEEQKLDPVGKEDSDVNNDGKVDSSDSYLKKRRAAIGKAMGKKMKEEADNYVEAYVTELHKTTMGSYVKKASKDLSDRRFDQGRSEKATYEPDKDDDKEEMKLRQREKGISRAATKLSKEETEVDEAMMVKGYQKGGMVKGYQKGGMVKKEEVEEVDEAMSSYDRARKAAARRAADRNAKRRRGEMGGRMERETYTSEGGTEMHHKGYRATPMKKEGLSNWREDLSNLIEVAPMTDVEMEKEVKEKKVNNKVTINPKMSEAVAQIGGELIAEKEVDVPDTRRTVDAIRAYDRSKDASRDATYDTMHGKKKKGDIEKKYAKKERGEIDKDDPNWMHKKYHTGMHGEEYIGKPKKKKKGHDCASKVKHEEYGIGNCIPKMHTLDENNMVTHYDVEFEEYIVENCPVEELVILQSSNHHHSEMKEGVVSKEVKALSKANKTMKDTPVVKADKIDTPNYKGQKFGVKEEDDKFIQKAIKRPGAFTRKAKAAGMGVQQFAKNVDDNPDKYSTRTKRQANLAQTLTKLSKEDVEELFYTLIAE